MPERCIAVIKANGGPTNYEKQFFVDMRPYKALISVSDHFMQLCRNCTERVVLLLLSVPFFFRSSLYALEHTWTYLNIGHFYRFKGDFGLHTTISKDRGRQYIAAVSGAAANWSGKRIVPPPRPLRRHHLLTLERIFEWTAFATFTPPFTFQVAAGRATKIFFCGKQDS